jgi:hypothetical protein
MFAVRQGTSRYAMSTNKARAGKSWCFHRLRVLLWAIGGWLARSPSSVRNKVVMMNLELVSLSLSPAPPREHSRIGRLRGATMMLVCHRQFGADDDASPQRPSTAVHTLHCRAGHSGVMRSKPARVRQNAGLRFAEAPGPAPVPPHPPQYAPRVHHRTHYLDVVSINVSAAKYR